MAHPGYPLSDETIAAILRRLKSDPTVTHAELAREFGISRQTIWKIARGMRVPKAETVRCPSCGRKVLPPCLACSVSQESKAG